MSDHNALPAIFTDKENSTYLEKLSTVKSADELRNLCEQRTRLESMRLVNYESYMSITGRTPYVTHKTRRSCLSEEDRAKYDTLREERHKLMDEQINCGRSRGEKEYRWTRWVRINAELYAMTGHNGYRYT